MTYKGVIKLGKEKVEEYQKILDLGENLGEELNLNEGTYASYTHRFESGKFVEISLCVGQVNAYIDTVLYDEEGYELCVSEPDFDVLGSHIFWKENERYILEIKE